MSEPIDLSVLQSESRNPSSADIDLVSTEELCRIINDEDQKVAGAIQPCLPVIAEAIDCLSSIVKAGKKVIYVGAGTSGRLGVLDASELPPTYSADPSQFVALIAGGDQALRHAQEGAEDNVEQAIQDLRDVDLRSGDAIIGIAASGRTPYVLSCLRHAKSKGCATVGIACSSPSAMGKSGDVDFMIEAVSGPEVVTGSTRMKAGSATKMVLNMLSTGIQIKNGKTFGNMMVDVRATNLKLEQRARNIIREVCGASCPRSDEGMNILLREAGGSVKVAITMVALRTSAAKAQQELAAVDGLLARVLADAGVGEQPVTNIEAERPYVLCIDGGGSKCAAYILTRDGEAGTAIGPACNVTTSTRQAALATIRSVAQQAIDACPSLQGQRLEKVKFSRVWIGLAGIDRPEINAALRQPLKELFHPQSRNAVTVTNDLELCTAACGSQSKDVCVLVAGTGSIAMAFRKTWNGYTKLSRAGGWGPLLGDDGSGFDIGRQALRHVLEIYDDKDDSEDSLVEGVLRSLKISSSQNVVQEVLSSVLLPSENNNPDARQRIAGVARIVLELQDSSPIASQIVSDSITSMTRLVQRAIRSTGLPPASFKLVGTGGLLNALSYQTRLQEALIELGLGCLDFKAVLEPGLAAAQALIAAEVDRH